MTAVATPARRSLLRRSLTFGCAGLLVLLAVAAALIGPTLYRSFVGLKRFEAVPPALPGRLARPALLVFSKTNGYREDSAIAAANAALVGIAAGRGWSVFLTENGAVFNPRDLARFDMVLWNNVSGNVLTPAQRAAFRGWIERGGGFVAIHGSGGDPHYDWAWYPRALIGAQFVTHTMSPQIQAATVVIERSGHPVTQGLPRAWRRVDEWYSFDRSVRGVDGYEVFASLDERSYEVEGFAGADIRMGDHPIVWGHCVGAGRVVYSGLGHTPESYVEPLHVRLIAQALDWTIGGCPPPTPKPSPGRPQ